MVIAVLIPNGSKGLIFADGAGAGAAVTDLLDGFSLVEQKSHLRQQNLILWMAEQP